MARPATRSRHSVLPAGALLLLALAGPGGSARAVSFDAGGVRVDWDTDLDLIGALQARRVLVGQDPVTYGPAAAYRSMTTPSARLDFGSALDVGAGDLGVRASARASVGDLYEALDPAGSGLFVLRYPGGGSVAAAPGSVRHGDLEPLDAYIHDTLTIGDDQRLTVRLGRQVLVWGESVYFPQNGLAFGQAPIDATRFRSESGYQADAAFRPVAQASFSWQPTGGLAVEGYWQFEFRPSRISALGAYDLPDALLAAPDLQRLAQTAPGTAPVSFAPTDTAEPAPLDQGGLSLKGRAGALDLGLYVERWTARTPTVFLHPPVAPYGQTVGGYDLIYPDRIEAVGASAAGHLGRADFGLEASVRHGMPLVAAAIVVPDGAGDAGLLPRGDTIHAQASLLYTTPPLPLVPAGAGWTTELAVNGVLARQNGVEAMPGRSRAAAAFRTLFEPQFYQVLPRLDLSLPIGLGYGLAGNSATDPTMTRGTGDLELGLTGHFDQIWHAALGWTHYLGRNRALYLPFAPNGAVDPLAQGDFVALTLGRSF